MSPAPLHSLILVRAVQSLEQRIALDDASAMQAAHAQACSPSERVSVRAAELAREHGLSEALAQWRGRLLWVGIAAAALVGLLSYGLVKAVVGGDRQINAVAALLAVLGPHMLSLLLWVVMLNVGASGGGMARWGSVLAVRLFGEREAAPNRRVLDAAIDVLAGKPGLSAWAFGMINHAIWSLALLLTLAGLVFAFSFLAYRLSWETTILDADFFAAFARISGWLPAQLGFATPDATQQGSDKGWALWLLGCTLVYGLGLRLVFLGLSVWRTSRLARQLTLDMSDPYVRQLMTRFAAMDQSETLDLEHKVPPLAASSRTLGATHGSSALIGYELPASVDWPPYRVDALLLARIAGAADEKRALLARLQQAPPRRLLIVCHAPASPDRGTERFLREMAQTAAQTALLLDGGSPRWLAWLAANGLPLAAVFDSVEAAQSWLAEA